MEPKWEFECPQFVDFTQTLSDQEDSDSWFDVDHEADENDSPFFMPETENTIIAQTMPVIVNKIPPPERVAINDDSGKMNKGGSNKNQTANKRSPLNNRSNVCSSIEEFYLNKKNKPSKITIDKENHTKKLPKSKPVHHDESDKPEGNNSQGSLSMDANSKPASVCSPNKKPDQNPANPTEKKSDSTTKPLKKLPVSSNKYNMRRSFSSGNIEKSSKQRFDIRRSNSSEKLAAKNRGGLDKMASSNTKTFSEVPKLKDNLLRTTKAMTSEQIEELKMERARNNALATKRLAEESLKKVKNSKGYQPVTSNKKLTVAKEFQFSSDKRLRSRSVDNVKSPISDFTRILRKGDNHLASKVPARTVVQPFKFSETSHNKSTTTSKFQSVAEQIINFSKKTPERFRTRQTKEPAPKKAWCAPRCTIAKSPQLSCIERSRPVHILSQKELEEKELEEIKMYQFKAKDVNRKILEAPVGVKEVPKKELTIVKPFDLPGSKIPSTKKAMTDDEIDYQFHAQPVPIDILRGVVGVKEPETIPLTIPASPAFALKQRISRPHIEEPKQENLIKKPKYRPYIHSGIKFEPKLDHRCTVQEPFTFDDRMKDYIVKKEEHIKKIYEENLKVSDFYANPIPNYKPGLPEKKPLALTKPEPFRLLIEERVEKRIEEKQSQLEEQARLLEEKFKFKAQPCDILKKNPFVPKLDHKYTAEVVEFNLNTELRQAQRQQYFEQKKILELETQALQLEKERIRQEEEEKEIQRLRTEAVHKAMPIRQYKPVEIQRNILPPTVPVTPKFCYKSRTRNLSHN